jgi:hypothetical protein
LAVRQDKGRCVFRNFKFPNNRARTLLSTAPWQDDNKEKRMTKEKFPPTSVREWAEFCWLLAVDPVFRAAPNKRKAYYEYRLGKIYSLPCF